MDGVFNNYDPNIGTLYSLRCPSCPGLSKEPQQWTPASPLSNISLDVNVGISNTTHPFPNSCPSSLPHLCVSEHPCSSCSGKTSKNYSWFLPFSHILHPTCKQILSALPAKHNRSHLLPYPHPGQESSPTASLPQMIRTASYVGSPLALVHIQFNSSWQSGL